MSWNQLRSLTRCERKSDFSTVTGSVLPALDYRFGCPPSGKSAVCALLGTYNSVRIRRGEVSSTTWAAPAQKSDVEQGIGGDGGYEEPNPRSTVRKERTQKVQAEECERKGPSCPPAPAVMSPSGRILRDVQSAVQNTQLHYHLLDCEWKGDVTTISSAL